MHFKTLYVYGLTGFPCMGTYCVVQRRGEEDNPRPHPNSCNTRAQREGERGRQAERERDRENANMRNCKPGINV